MQGTLGYVSIPQCYAKHANWKEFGMLETFLFCGSLMIILPR